MVTEKLGKGFLTEPGGMEQRHSHQAFVRFMRTAKARDEIKKAYGNMPTHNFRKLIDGLLPLADKIENLAPNLANGVNPEYPWQIHGRITAPADFGFPDIDLTAKNLSLKKLLTFIQICFDIANRELADV